MPVFTHEQLVTEAKALLDRSERQGFNRETEARVSQLIELAKLVRATEMSRFGRPSLPELTGKAWHRSIVANLDDAVLSFFRGEQFQSRVVSDTGVILEPAEGLVAPGGGGWGNHGRSSGAVSVMRDVSGTLNAQTRSYTGLAEGTGSLGGDVVPVGYIAQIFYAAKRVDQVLLFADWDTAATVDGRPTKLPALDDTAVNATVITEGGGQSFNNPNFAQVSFPNASRWSSGVILASVQLATDATPSLAGTLQRAFSRRIARGFGAAVVAGILADASTASYTAAANTKIQEGDLLGLMGAIDNTYASSERAAFAMSWSTFLSVISTANLSAAADSSAFLVRPNADGLYELYGRPVLISNSLSSTFSSGNVMALYGDFSRLLIRHVPNEQQVRMFRELHMPNHQFGYEMIASLDSAVVHGSSTDKPIAQLVLP